MVSRRAFLAAGAGLISSSCMRQKASGFPGYAFVANEDGQAVAAIDLEVFAVARHIHVDGKPTALAASRRRPLVYVLTPETGSVHEIRTDTLAFSRKIRVANFAAAMRLSGDGRYLYVLCRDPREVRRIDLEAFRVDWRNPLAAEPADFDLSPNGRFLAVTFLSQGRVDVVDIPSKRAATATENGELRSVRFRGDSEQIIAANLSERQLALFRPDDAKLMVRLPLAVRPDHLCFNADGGQLFISGEGMDAVVVVYPFYTPEVAYTILAGRQPGAMAASSLPPPAPQYLYATNPTSGDVSILDIGHPRLIAIATVGSDPGAVVLTPDNEYALVLNRGSGDMAVIRTKNLTRAVNEQKRSRKAPLFIMIPVGSRPVSATVVSV